MNRAWWRLWRVRCSTAVLRPRRSDESGSTPCEHEQISVAGLGGSKGQTGTEQCTFGEALGKLHTPKCLAPMPSPSLSDGMDASTPLLPPAKQVLPHLLCHSSSLPSPPSSRLIFSCCFHSFFPISACLASHLHAAALALQPHLVGNFCWTVGSTAALSLFGSQYSQTSLKDSSWEYQNVN
jgi:hypothetical protein